MPGLLTQIVLLSLATYRVTRFVIDDSLIERQRNWLFLRLNQGGQKRALKLGRINGSNVWQTKLLELLECPYCMSVWISAGATALMARTWSVEQPFWAWLATCGAAMAWWRLIETD